MADTAPRPRHVSDLDTYTVSAEDESVERKPEAGLSPEKELAQDIGSAASYRRRNPALDRTAEKIGMLLGTAVNAVKDLPSRLQAVPRRVGSLGERVRVRSEELREDVSEAAREWRQTARIRVQRARAQASQYAQENPFQVIAAVAGVAFALGLGLRIWRSSRE